MTSPHREYLAELRGILRQLRSYPEMHGPASPMVLQGPIPALTFGEKLLRLEARWFGGYCGERPPRENDCRRGCSLPLNHEGPHRAQCGHAWVYSD